MLELVAIVVQALSGPDGLYRTCVSDAIIQYVVVRDLIPQSIAVVQHSIKRTDIFIVKVIVYDRWVREFDIWVALDSK